MIRGYKERHGLDIVHAWGMTEMTPLGTLCNLPSSLQDAPAEEQFRYRAKQGTPLPFVEIRASDRRTAGAVGRQDDGRARSAGAVGGGAVLQRRRTRRSVSPTMAGSGPATS